jgi:hypothetical protein
MSSRQAHDKQVRINKAFNKTVNKQTMLFVRGLLKEPNISSGELKTKLDRSSYKVKASQRVDEEHNKVSYRIVASVDNIIVDGIQFTITGGIPRELQ